MTENGEVRRASDNFDYKKFEQSHQSIAQSNKAKKSVKIDHEKSPKNQKAGQLIKEMKKQWNLFQRGLEVENWQKAQQIQADLTEQKVHFQPLKVDTKSIYAQQFSFPEVAKNDYAADQLGNLEAAQNNLN